MKAFLKLFVFIVLILMSSLVFAGLGDGTDFGTDKDRNNTEEQLTPTESQDFGSGKDFSRDNFSQNDGVMDAGDGDDAPPMPPIPLDGSEIFLLIAGVSIGIKKLFGKKK